MLIEARKLLPITESIPFVRIESKIIICLHETFFIKSSISSFELDWPISLIDSPVEEKSFTTATSTSTTFVLFTFFGFSSILFSHFAPILCIKGHSLVRRSFTPSASSHNSNIQSIESHGRRESAIKENTDSPEATSKPVKTHRLSNSNSPSSSTSSTSTTTTTTQATVTTTTSTTFPPILSTRIMNLMMQTSLIARIVGAHIGEPCNSLFKICLPPSPHIYCDDNNICRCKNDYPGEFIHQVN